MLGKLWIGIRQRVPGPANILQLRTAIEEEWTNIQFSKTAHFRVAILLPSLRHTCAIIILSNRHLDMPHL